MMFLILLIFLYCRLSLAGRHSPKRPFSFSLLLNWSVITSHLSCSKWFSIGFMPAFLEPDSKFSFADFRSFEFSKDLSPYILEMPKIGQIKWFCRQAHKLDVHVLRLSRPALNIICLFSGLIGRGLVVFLLRPTSHEKNKYYLLDVLLFTNSQHVDIHMWA